MLEPPKKQQRKIAFSLMVIILAISVCVGGLVGYLASFISTSIRIDDLAGQLSAIQEQMSNIQAKPETPSQNQSDVLEALNALEDELLKIRDQIDDLQATNNNYHDNEQIMEEIRSLKNQLASLQGQINSINATTLFYENITYVLGENVSLSQLFEQIKDSVVVIQAVISSTIASQGSGFICNYTGEMIILTNNHVIENALRIDVTFSNGNTYSASLAGSNPNTDVAVLTTQALENEYAPLDIVSSSTLKVGDPVVVVGTPYGLPGSMSNGIVSALDRIILLEQTTLTHIIQTTAPLNPGNSGGPLINYAGQVVGMATAIVEDSQGIGFAIPSDTILRDVMDILN